MKIKRGKPASEPIASPESEPRSEPRFVSKSTGRILVPITASGLIDLAKMNRDSRKQLTDLIKSEPVQKQLGFGPPTKTFDPKQCEYLYDAVGRFYQTLGKYLLKYPDRAQRELLYTDEEKRQLGEPTAAMLDSYAPQFLADHQALLAWGVMFASITQQKFAKAGEVAALEKKNPGRVDIAPAESSIVFPSDGAEGPAN